jgi:hypothetical protein
VSTCDFCADATVKVCDGRLENGKTCDKRMCWRHTKTLALVHTQDPKTRRRRGDTRDLCPDCVAAGKSPWAADAAKAV